MVGATVENRSLLTRLTLIDPSRGAMSTPIVKHIGMKRRRAPRAQEYAELDQDSDPDRSRMSNGDISGTTNES